MPMFVATAIISVLLAATLAYAAVRKLSHRPEVVGSYVRVGVPEDKLDYLAVVLLTGAVGLVIGLFLAPIGIAAAIGVLCYFTLAVAAHIRADDTENLPTPAAIVLVSVAALVLRLSTL